MANMLGVSNHIIDVMANMLGVSNHIIDGMANMLGVSNHIIDVMANMLGVRFDLWLDHPQTTTFVFYASHLSTHLKID
jgi:hypothetical protein